MLQFFIPQIAITIAITVPSGSGETHIKGHHEIQIWIVHARNKILFEESLQKYPLRIRRKGHYFYSGSIISNVFCSQQGLKCSFCGSGQLLGTMIVLPLRNHSLRLNSLVQTPWHHSAILPLLLNKADLTCFDHTCWETRGRELNRKGFGRMTEITQPALSASWNRCCSFGNDCSFTAEKLKSKLVTSAPYCSHVEEFCLQENLQASKKG